MKVLKVIHGFPPDYMAGSEIYSYHIVKALSKKIEQINVFTGVENEFSDEYEVYDEVYDNIEVHRINKLRRDYSYREKFYDESIELDFREFLNKTKPDIVHFGHLSHLSTKLLNITANEYHIPIVFTVHDFWLFCVKGQLINQNNDICSGPSAEKCHYCSPYQTSIEEVQKHLIYMQEILQFIDVFLVPSHTLRNYFIQQGVPEEKLIYSKYGFDTRKITYRKRSYNPSSSINFGFMGRIIPSKGIRVLIDAFKNVAANLSIYGNIGSQKRFLEQKNIQFKGKYDNNSIDQILSQIDVLIVPSIWLENSPLVIQEAFLSGIPVVTSNIGGMKELIKDGANGYLFEVNNPESLKKCIIKIIHNPTLLNDLSVSRQDVRTIEEDADFISNIYKKVYPK
ncbi:glycosyltransferase family 4 protein [Desulfobacterota bacterium M19]